jgi:DNA-binding MarR family transcriptional regulator
MSKAVAVPFETTLLVRDHCLCLHLQRSARKIARRFDEALRPVGLTNGQFSLLMSLNRPESPAMGAVAALLAMDRTTLTAALKPLERRALVTVAPDPADRRSRRMSLTAAGGRLLARAVDLGDHPCGDRGLARRPRDAQAAGPAQTACGVPRALS